MCDLISVKHNFSRNDEYSHFSQNAICLKEKTSISLSLRFGAESLVRDSADCSGLQPCPQGSMKVRLNPAFCQSLVFPSNKGGCPDWWSLRPPTAQIPIKRRGLWTRHWFAPEWFYGRMSVSLEAGYQPAHSVTSCFTNWCSQNCLISFQSLSP